MADGAELFRRRTLHSLAEDADPRFSTSLDNFPADGKSAGKKPGILGSRAKNKPAPKIAFTGEEYGFGFQAVREFLDDARQNKYPVPDAGLASLGNVRLERELAEASDNDKFDYGKPVSQPLRSKEQALMAVQQGTADFAVVPFYNPYFGYDYESLRALANLIRLRGVQQVDASDKYCLAVHESQLFDIIQSSHPGSAFSALQRRMRQSYGAPNRDSENDPGATFQAEVPEAGLPLDPADQKLIRDRIDVVFAGPEAARRCKSKLDGLRALGVETRELSEMVEPHRELARLARASVNTDRQTNTFFDPTTGETRHFSTLGAETQASRLYAMVLPYEIALRSTDYTIIDHNIDDGEPPKTRFLVVENNPDHTLFEDKYRTTDAKTKYWRRRVTAVANPRGAFGAGFMNMFGYFAGVAATLLVVLGLLGPGVALAGVALPSALGWISSMSSLGLMLLGGAFAIAAYVLLSVEATGSRGVRMMMHFRRDRSAASIGDVEDFLRNFGVRHAVVRLDEDSESDAPAAVMLDVEFAKEDFAYGPIAMLRRRLRGSVVNGALKTAFQRWKNRGVAVLAVTPIEDVNGKPAYQLPKHKSRHWFFEGLPSLASEFVETWFIRLSRILFMYVFPVALIYFIVWKGILNG